MWVWLQKMPRSQDSNQVFIPPPAGSLLPLSSPLCSLPSLSVFLSPSVPYLSAASLGLSLISLLPSLSVGMTRSCTINLLDGFPVSVSVFLLISRSLWISLYFSPSFSLCDPFSPMNMYLLCLSLRMSLCPPLCFLVCWPMCLAGFSSLCHSVFHYLSLCLYSPLCCLSPCLSVPVSLCVHLLSAAPCLSLWFLLFSVHFSYFLLRESDFPLD